MLKFKLLILVSFFSGCANYISNMHQEFDSYDKNRNRGIQSQSQLESLAEGDKRYNADDFSDSGSNNSLWVGNGRESFFSSGGVRKEKGDLVTIHVYQKLKDQITSELTRLYPNDQSDSKKTPSEKAKNENTNAATADPKSGIHDKISVVVSKEVRENHLILTGRKQLMFKNNRHLIEIQALIHRKDISTDDSLNSDKIIQSNLRVLR